VVTYNVYIIDKKKLLITVKLSVYVPFGDDKGSSEFG
jgi:hypothetical protein